MEADFIGPRDENVEEANQRISSEEEYRERESNGGMKVPAWALEDARQLLVDQGERGESIDDVCDQSPSDADPEVISSIECE